MVSVMLVQEDKVVQIPIYYVSKSLLSAKTYYSHLKKLAYSRSDCSQVQALLSLLPNNGSYYLPAVQIHKPELSRRMAKWVVKLSKFNIE